MSLYTYAPRSPQGHSSHMEAPPPNPPFLNLALVFSSHNCVGWGGQIHKMGGGEFQSLGFPTFSFFLLVCSCCFKVYICAAHILLSVMVDLIVYRFTASIKTYSLNLLGDTQGIK